MWKASKYGFFLVRIFPYSDWIRTRQNFVLRHFSHSDFFSIWNFDFVQLYLKKSLHAFFLQATLSFKSASVLLNFFMNFKMLFRCCLVPISIIIMIYFICFLYLCLCLDLGLFMSHLCDLFFFFFSIFIMINRIISWIQTHLFFC